jgi:hypothetical protein
MLKFNNLTQWQWKAQRVVLDLSLWGGSMDAHESNYDSRNALKVPGLGVQNLMSLCRAGRMTLQAQQLQYVAAQELDVQNEHVGLTGTINVEFPQLCAKFCNDAGLLLLAAICGQSCQPPTGKPPVR